MAEIITHDGVEYRKDKRKAEVGDLIRYDVDGKDVGYSRVVADEFDVDDFYTEDGAYIWVACGDSYEVLEEIAEPQPDVTDLIANLGRRLHEVEEALSLKNEEITLLHDIGVLLKDRVFELERQNGEQASESGIGGAGMTQDAVNSPPHYTQGAVEVIDYIDQVADGYEGKQAYYVGNIVKYVSRAPHKNGVEDLRKAAWYLTRLIDVMETGDSE